MIAFIGILLQYSKFFIMKPKTIAIVRWVQRCGR